MYLHLPTDHLHAIGVENESDHSTPEQHRVHPSEHDERVIALLALPEGPTLEFKRVSGKMVSKALETICAFANSNGGTLILGVADPSVRPARDRVHGVEENPEAVDELRRKTATQFDPPGVPVRWLRLPATTAGGTRVHLLILRIGRSEHVHSIVGDGTWKRLSASNCQMTAREITELSYRRGDRSAETERVDVDCSLLDTPTWRTYVTARGLTSGSLTDQLLRVGLAVQRGEAVQPRRAAVLLFADEPGGHLGALGTRCELRLLVYRGSHVESGQTPNLRKAPHSFRGPLVHLTDIAVRAVADEIAVGVAQAGSGFETRHRIPLRVVKEAIVNAIVHRDYRLNRDIFVRIFDNRIEVESPGALPGAITPANIRCTGSRTRNPLIARALFDFPVRPNIDAGEGVRMMFSEMECAGLYPPQYRESSAAAGDLVTVILLSEPKLPLWDLVSDWIDGNGPISNSVVCKLGNLDTWKVSRLLRRWKDLGLLQVVDGRGQHNRTYEKVAAAGKDEESFAGPFANDDPDLI